MCHVSEFQKFVLVGVYILIVTLYFPHNCSTVKRKWTDKKRTMMYEMGLYKRHKLDHDLLQSFAVHLNVFLKIDNYKQEVGFNTKTCMTCIQL